MGALHETLPLSGGLHCSHQQSNSATDNIRLLQRKIDSHLSGCSMVCYSYSCMLASVLATLDVLPPKNGDSGKGGGTEAHWMHTTDYPVSSI